MKVLVVDDSDVLRKITVFNLKKLGMEVEEAVDGVDGLEKMRSWRPDVVILDIMMPRMDGFTVLKEMKKDETIKDIPVIVLTAKGGQDDEQIALSLGAKKVMTKPFSPTQLVEEVKSLVNG